MELRRHRIVVETSRYRITGDLTLPREGYRSRLSEYLNHGDVAFLALTDAEIVPLEGLGAAPERRPFIAVAVRHVEVAYDAEGD
ncbi:MAG TPA: hypothetical protein VIL04_05080 [Solirubrobacterales bacterium]|jgi:hypothetical protein